MEIVTTEILPPESSMAGTNTCYCHCQALNKRSNYGVCLFTLKAYEEGKLREDSDCYSVINCGNCEARRYRQQERDAGRALFFKKREIPVAVVSDKKETQFDRNSDSYKRGWARAGSTSVSTPVRSAANPTVTAPKPIKKSDEGFSIKGSLADAVNAAMKQESAMHVTPSAKPVSTNKPMSLLERARLVAASK